MKKISLSLILLVSSFFLMNTCSQEKKNKIGQSRHSEFVIKSFKLAEEQLSLSLKRNKDSTKFPRTIDEKGNLVTNPAKIWISGFYPGCLWFMYEFTGEEKWKREAVKWTESLRDEQFDTTTHDVGFIINTSFGQANRIMGNEVYKDVIINAAKSLATRYDEKVGCTKSWDWGEQWKFPVIIDNMMNLELLFIASKLSGDETYRNIAISHAKTTMANHFRPNYSSYHLVDYNPENGEVIKKMTFQGHADESSWSRGQGWGLYGFTYCYRETGDTAFLNLAKHIADFIIKNPNTPKDLIPVWDYDLYGIKGEPRDASSASLIASGLLELSLFVGDDSTQYFNYAEKLLVNLSSDKYLAQPGTNNNFILMHSTGDKPHGREIDVPIVYADYYFLEALLKYKKLKNR